MTNPLNVDVTLANLTVTVHESGTEEPSSNDLADVEVLSSIILDARETRTVSQFRYCVYSGSHL
jgi:hypothetical protein